MTFDLPTNISYYNYYKHVQCTYVCYNADVDECDNFPNLCSPGGMCVNNDDGGFYRCECNDGFTNNNVSASRFLENCIGMWYIQCAMYIHMGIIL